MDLRFFAHGLCVVLAILAVSPNHSCADVSEANTTGAFIPDDGSILEQTITITDSEIISSAFFTIRSFQHTYVGDLEVKVRHLQSGRTATLFSRVGPAPTHDESNLFGIYSFVDGTADFVLEAANGGTAYNMATGSYQAIDSSENDVSLDTIFAGDNTAGDWIFSFQDFVAGDAGSIGTIQADFVSSAIPEPVSGFAIVSLLGFAAFRRRRTS